MRPRKERRQRIESAARSVPDSARDHPHIAGYERLTRVNLAERSVLPGSGNLAQGVVAALRAEHPVQMLAASTPADFNPDLLSSAWRVVHGTAVGDHLTHELEREVSPAHVLKGADFAAVAVRGFTADPQLNLSSKAIEIASAFNAHRPKQVIYGCRRSIVGQLSTSLGRPRPRHTPVGRALCSLMTGTRLSKSCTTATGRRAVSQTMA